MFNKKKQVTPTDSGHLLVTVKKQNQDTAKHNKIDQVGKLLDLNQ
jgi:hypothetical protein